MWWNGGENEYIEPKLGAARGRAKKEGKGGTEVKAKRTDRAAAAEAVVTVQNIFSLSKKRVGPDQNRLFFFLIKNWQKYRVFIKYCVFSKILKYIPDSGLSQFSSVVYTDH